MRPSPGLGHTKLPTGFSRLTVGLIATSKIGDLENGWIMGFSFRLAAYVSQCQNLSFAYSQGHCSEIDSLVIHVVHEIRPDNPADGAQIQHFRLSVAAIPVYTSV